MSGSPTPPHGCRCGMRAPEVPLPTNPLRQGDIPATLWASAVSVALVHWVTMRSVFEVWGPQSYGFPLTAFGLAGLQTHGPWVAVVPTVVDIACYVALTFPAAMWVGRRISAAANWRLALAAWLLVAAAHWEWLGFAVRRELSAPAWADAGPLGTDWPINCRTVWVGPLHANLSADDADDECARRCLADGVGPPNH